MQIKNILGVYLAGRRVHKFQPRRLNSTPWLSRSSLLHQNLAELLPGQLPRQPFHFHFKERSQNFAGVQATRFHDVVNVPQILMAQQLINLFPREL